jgi:hypothetical protein
MTNALKNAVEDLLDGTRLSVVDAMDRHFAPTFRQRVNGQWDDRAVFSARMAALRDVVREVTITVLDEMADGTRYGERHVVELVQHDGERVVQEIFVFAERDHDGRFVRIEEATVSMQR